MLKALEDVTATKKRLKIEIPAETIEAEIGKGLQDARKHARFPGFRPGKAPMSLVEKKFSKNVEADVLEKLVPQFYADALKEASVKPVSRPEMENSFDYKRNQPLTMTITIDVMPTVENLNYEGIAVKDVPVEVKDEEVDAVLKNLTEEKATYESTDDAIQTGDLVTMDYTIKGEETVTKDAVLKVGGGPYPPEFFERLTGKKKGDAAEIEAAFPADMQSPFAGKKPTFEVTIKEVKKRNIPALDDEFAKDLGMEDLEQVKTKVRENITAAKVRNADLAKQREILDKLLETHAFEAPESLVNAEIGGIVDEIRASGKDDRTDEALREELSPNAEKSVKASLLLEIIGEKEGVTVSEEEMREELLSIAQRYYISPENVIKYYMAKDGSLDGVKHAVFERKVLNLLLEKAKIEKGE